MSDDAAAFVGREQELALLDDAWTRARDRVGGLVLICGDPGMGKSRLLEVFAARQRERGNQVWLGQCWEAGGAPTYWPWTQALRALTRSLGLERLRERLGHRAALLRDVVPELATAPGDAEVSADPDQARFQVFDAVGELLTEAAYEAPVCIALEDLHAADEASVLLLEFLARANPTLIIGTYREKEAARGPMGSTLARIARRATIISLAPLTAPDIARLLETAWGERPDDALVTRLHRASEGNPLFVAELQRRWRDVPASRQDPQLEVPPGIEATIAEHLGELDPQTRRVLEHAAVLGREFETGTLARLLDLEDDALMTHLSDACQADLLHPAGPSAHRFAHFMHRAVIYQAIPTARRANLHLRVTELLRAQSDADAMPWSTLAHHYFAAGHLALDRAIEAAAEAARAAYRRRAFADAASLYQRACEALEGTPESGGKRHLELLLRLAQAQIDAGAPQSGRQTCDEAAELARAADDPVSLARAALTYGAVFELGVINPRLVALLEQAKTSLGDDHPALLAQLLGRQAAALQPSANPQEPIALAREAIALARQTRDKRVLLATMRSAISAMMDLGDPEERVLLNEEHIDLALELSEPIDAMRGHLRLIMDALELGDFNRADRHLDALTRIADELSLPHFQWLAYGVQSLRAQIEGRWNAAARWAEQMRVYGARTQETHFSITVTLHELGALRMRGEHEELLRRIDDGSAWPVDDNWARVFADALGASALARLGRADEARDRLPAGLIHHVLATGDPMTVVCVAEVAAAAGDRALASSALDVLEKRRGRCVNWGVLGMSWDGPVDRVLGLLEACLGRREEAVRSLDAAEQLCRRLGTPLHLRVVREDRARVFGDAISGPAPSSTEVATDATTPAPLELVREGEMWTLAGREPKVFFKNTRGMQMLARLLAEPGRELHVLDLAGSLGADRGDAGPILDERARTEYRRRAEHLRSELAEAEEWNDTARAERLRSELDALTKELARAVGLGGRSRKSESAVERARVNVQRRIRDAIRRIGKQDEQLGRQLDRSVRTGTYCAYEPD